MIGRSVAKTRTKAVHRGPSDGRIDEKFHSDEVLPARRVGVQALIEIHIFGFSNTNTNINKPALSVVLVQFFFTFFT